MASLLLAVALLLVAALLGNASAATYVVGDTLGWRVPNTPADYSNWASQHTFAVGDVLVFSFMSGAHDVAQVTKASFDGCSSNSPLLLQTVGPSNITLTSAGETFYICTFGSHCSLGQKLAINVSASSTPAPAPTPTPTMPPTTAPMPPPTTPAPTMPPTPAPSMPAPTPTPTPSPAMPAPTPAPAPMPSGGGTPPGPGPAPGDVTPPPPPPPSSATISTGSASLVGFAFVAIGLMI